MYACMYVCLYVCWALSAASRVKLLALTMAYDGTSVNNDDLEMHLLFKLATLVSIHQVHALFMCNLVKGWNAKFQSFLDIC